MQKTLFNIIICWLYCFTLHANAADTATHIIVHDSAFLNLIEKNVKPIILYTNGIWLEGPQVLPDKSLIFSDVKANMVLRYDEHNGVSVWLKPSHFQNGHTLDNNKQLLAASHGKRSIERLENGEWKTIIESYNGKKFNSPNDVIVDKDGDIWFSDPNFGIKNKQESYGGEIEQDGEYSYRYSKDSKKVVRLHTPLVKAPNGLAFSPDEKTLYIADAQKAYNSKDSTLHHHIVSYTINNDKSLSNEKIFAVIESGFPDGIKVDPLGNVWSSSGNGISIFSPQGKLLGEIILGHVAGNLAFGKDKKGNSILYITANNTLYKIPIKIAL